MAKNLHQQITRLSPGKPAPELILMDQNQNEIRLSSFRGKYVYLNFGTSWNLTFQKELIQLKELYARRIPDFEIITVSLDNDFAPMAALAREKGYNWVFGHYNFNPSVSTTWNLKILPAFYLIGPEGNLVFSPAPFISENFREMFQPILDEQRREFHRRQGLRQRN
jgi:hypothetical protein